MDPEDEVLRSLLERCRTDHAAWINGDADGYEFEDSTSTIMGAFGGTSIGSAAATPGQRRVVQLFERGTGTVELVQAGRSEHTAWLVLIERARVVFAESAESRRWDLRVTEVFEERDGRWVRVHRHADALVERHPLDTVLGLLPDA